MNTRAYVAVHNGKVLIQGALDEVSAYAKANLDKRLVIRTADAQASIIARPKGTAAGDQVTALVAQGVVPLEAVKKAIAVLSDIPRYAGGTDDTGRRYNGYGVVKAGMAWLDNPNAQLSAKQMAWLVDQAAAVKAQEKALRKLSSAV